MLYKNEIKLLIKSYESCPSSMDKNIFSRAVDIRNSVEKELKEYSSKSAKHIELLTNSIYIRRFISTLITEGALCSVIDLGHKQFINICKKKLDQFNIKPDLNNVFDSIKELKKDWKTFRLDATKKKSIHIETARYSVELISDEIKKKNHPINDIKALQQGITSGYLFKSTSQIKSTISKIYSNEYKTTLTPDFLSLIKILERILITDFDIYQTIRNKSSKILFNSLNPDVNQFEKDARIFMDALEDLLVESKDDWDIKRSYMGKVLDIGIIIKTLVDRIKHTKTVYDEILTRKANEAKQQNKKNVGKLPHK